MPARLSHTDARGRVRMVDVGEKVETAREAVASAAVRMSANTLALALGEQRRGAKRSVGGAPKGDVLATARVAAMLALKRTSDLIPLCHPVRLVGSTVEIDADRRLPGLRVRVSVRAFDRTGVEMEALVGASTAALTIYDMVKGAERGVEIMNVRLEEKRGGRTGEWRRREEAPPRQPQKGRGKRVNAGGGGDAREPATGLRHPMAGERGKET